MPRLVIGNCFTDEVAGDATRLPGPYLQTVAASAQLAVWFARDGDVVVLPVEPDEEFLRYVTRMTGVCREAVHIVVPPPGVAGTDLLTADRLTHPLLLRRLAELVAPGRVEEIIALTPEASVVALADAFLGAREVLPGHRFLRQGGGRLANSKAVFRAVAAGAGVPIPAGGVATNRTDIRLLVESLLAEGPVILKRDFAGGGMGNEILSTESLTGPSGAQRAVVLRAAAAVRNHLDNRWDWLTNGDRFPVIVERYVPGSRAVFAEFTLGEGGPVFEEQGEMIYAPVAEAQIIPAPTLEPAAVVTLVNGGTRLCSVLHAMGHRGNVSVDALVTPEGEILYTEFNARVTGSTHIYQNVGRNLVGENFVATRFLAEYCNWTVPSFGAAERELARSGLAYDAKTRTGVVLVKAFSRADGTVRFCVVAEDLEATTKIRDKVQSLFAIPPA